MKDKKIVGEPCEKCGVFVKGFEYQGCCSGHECGCGGRPIEPCYCAKCWELVMSNSTEDKQND